MSEAHYTDTDGEGNRYRIPVDKADDWDAWRHLDEDSPCGLSIPDYAVAVADGAMVAFGDSE